MSNVEKLLAQQERRIGELERKLNALFICLELGHRPTAAEVGLLTSLAKDDEIVTQVQTWRAEDVEVAAGISGSNSSFEVNDCVISKKNALPSNAPGRVTEISDTIIFVRFNKGGRPRRMRVPELRKVKPCPADWPIPKV